MPKSVNTVGLQQAFSQLGQSNARYANLILEQRRKEQEKKSGLFRTIGAVAGGMMGGPPGAMIGSSLGGAVAGDPVTARDAVAIGGAFATQQQQESDAEAQKLITGGLGGQNTAPPSDAQLKNEWLGQTYPTIEPITESNTHPQPTPSSEELRGKWQAKQPQFSTEELKQIDPLGSTLEDIKVARANAQKALSVKGQSPENRRTIVNQINQLNNLSLQVNKQKARQNFELKKVNFKEVASRQKAQFSSSVYNNIHSFKENPTEETRNTLIESASHPLVSPQVKREAHKELLKNIENQGDKKLVSKATSIYGGKFKDNKKVTELSKLLAEAKTPQGKEAIKTVLRLSEKSVSSSASNELNKKRMFYINKAEKGTLTNRDKLTMSYLFNPNNIVMSGAMFGGDNGGTPLPSQDNPMVLQAKEAISQGRNREAIVEMLSKKLKISKEEATSYLK
jgi:hypothetical protein